MAKEEGAHDLLTNCPPSILFLEQGLEVMREAGEHVEFCSLGRPSRLTSHLASACWICGRRLRLLVVVVLPAANMAIKIYNL